MNLSRLTKAALLEHIASLEEVAAGPGGPIGRAVAELVERQHPEMLTAEASALAEIAYRLAGLLDSEVLELKSAAGISKELRATLKGLVIDDGDDDEAASFFDELSTPVVGDPED